MQKKRIRVPVVLPAGVQKEVVRAVHSIGIEVGGVDLLVARDGVYHIAEVNFPFDFTSAQRVTGVDVAAAMLAHLMAKASQHSL